MKKKNILFFLVILMSLVIFPLSTKAISSFKCVYNLEYDREDAVDFSNIKNITYESNGTNIYVNYAESKIQFIPGSDIKHALDNFGVPILYNTFYTSIDSFAREIYDETIGCRDNIYFNAENILNGIIFSTSSNGDKDAARYVLDDEKSSKESSNTLTKTYKKYFFRKNSEECIELNIRLKKLKGDKIGNSGYIDFSRDSNFNNYVQLKASNYTETVDDPTNPSIKYGIVPGDWLAEGQNNIISFDNDSFLSNSDVKVCNIGVTYYIYTGNLKTIDEHDCKELSTLDSCPTDTPSSDYGNEPEIKDVNFCEENGTKTALRIVGYILFILKILIPLVLIAMGVIDFAKAVTSSDDNATTSALGTLFKRIIAGIIIFFIPTILNFVFGLIDNFNDTVNNGKFDKCTTCLFNPGECGNSNNAEN